MDIRERVLGYKLIELFEDFLESDLNDGFIDMAVSLKHGFVVLTGFSKEDSLIDDACAFKESNGLFKQLLHEYKLAYLNKWQKEMGCDVDDESLTEIQKNELQMKLDYYTTKWKDIYEEITKNKSIEAINQEYHELINKYALVR